MKKFTEDLLIRQKHEFDLAVWSSANRDDTLVLAEKIYGKFLRQLLFVTFEDSGSLQPKSKAKNLANIWSKYPQHNEQSTIVISSQWNEVVDFQRNDIVIPEFEPKLGRTDFLSDSHLTWMGQYLRFILTL